MKLGRLIIVVACNILIVLVATVRVGVRVAVLQGLTRVIVKIIV